MSDIFYISALELCIEQLLTDDKQFFFIRSNCLEEVHIFFDKLHNLELFSGKKITVLHPENKDDLQNAIRAIDESKIDYIFIHSKNYLEFDEFLSIIDEELDECKVIAYCKKNTKHTKVTFFDIPLISFREFLESKKINISTPYLLKNGIDKQKVDMLFEEYSKKGAHIHNISSETISHSDFELLCTNIKQELFEKEYEQFDEFLIHIAMNIGTLYKEDGIAQEIGISRRKVRKYTELLLKHNIIEQVFPFFEDKKTELSRHEKLYFSDLSYYHSIMKTSYRMGRNKNSVIENFVYLELIKRLEKSHEICFWKKKSGTDISFVLINKENEKLTPIEITLRASEHLPKSIKSFYHTYNERIEYGMLLNEDKIKNFAFKNKAFLVLPYTTI